MQYIVEKSLTILILNSKMISHRRNVCIIEFLLIQLKFV